MAELGISRTQILNELNRSAHGNLQEYEPIIGEACRVDPEFVARLIAYDFINGQIKDSKIALPILTIAHRDFPEELIENSLAHLAMQSPRELLRGLTFSIERGTVARRQRMIERLVRAYLIEKEAVPEKWSRTVARHRRTMKELYIKAHAPMAQWASAVLFGFYKNERGERIALAIPPGSIFADIANLARMDPAQAAAAIQKWHLSPLVVSGAMAGAKSKQEDAAVVQATINQMSATEVVTRAASIERKGIQRDATLKETVRKKIAGATKSGKATLKTGVAAEEVEDESLKTMLKELQERQIQSQKEAGRGIDGNWLIIGDKSASQEASIELAKQVAAAIAKFVTGRVWLVFCDGGAQPAEVTGLSLEQIQTGSKWVRAAGNTSYGVGLEWASRLPVELDGVAIVGDGGENTAPFFAMEWREYARKRDKRLPVYLYQTYCEPRYADTPGGNPRNFEVIMSGASPLGYGWGGSFTGAPVPFTVFDLTHGKVDHYSVPNLVQSMSASRFGVIEKIMACPMVSLDQVLPLAAQKGATKCLRRS